MTPLDIDHLARLARLELDQTEKIKFADQLGTILTYFKKLKEVDTANIELMSQLISPANIYRNDEASLRQPDMEQKIINNFPDKQGRYDRVDKIM